MDIVIVGAGNVGRALGGGWRKAGHGVTMAVRDLVGSRAAELKQEGFDLVTPKDAAEWRISWCSQSPGRRSRAR
jgi:predicted dinucleotide-binding enzyme